MQSRVGIIVLAIAAGAALSGCLVDKKPPKEIYRGTDTLRDYTAGKWIAYNVTATSLTEDTPTQTGSLNIEWKDHVPLIDPDTGDSIPVLQEITKLTINGETRGTVRYISQDTDNSIQIHAIEDLEAVTGTDHAHYWLSTSGGTALADLAPMTIIKSPLDVANQPDPVAFTVMDGCENSPSCGDPIGTFVDALTVEGDAPSPINTNLGKFMDPIRISFEGNSQPIASVVSTLFDIRDACGSGLFTEHRGSMDIMPEIGIVRMDNICGDTDELGIRTEVRYIFTLSNTNIALP
jgi:hypothetical protein